MMQEAYLLLSKWINSLGYMGREKTDNWSGLHTTNKISDTKCLEIKAKGAQRANKRNLLMAMNN